MSLREIKTYLKDNEVATIQEIVRETGMEKDKVEMSLDFLIGRGYVREEILESSDSSCPRCSKAKSCCYAGSRSSDPKTPLHFYRYQGN